MRTLLPRALLTWFLFIPIAVANGIIRETFYAPHVGGLAAHQISTAIAIAAFAALSYALLRTRMTGASPATACFIGALWVMMTIAFEVGFGHYVDGAPWSTLLADYDLSQGRVWSLFLLTLFLTPFVLRKS